MIPQSASEFQHRYSGTYVGVPVKNAVLPFLVDTVDGEVVYGSTLNDKLRVESNKFNWEDIDFNFPQLGNIQIGTSVYFVTRKTYRIYKRGVLNDFIVTNRLGVLPSSVIDQLISPTARQIIYAVYNPVFSDDVNSAAEKVLSGEYMATALSHQYSIALNCYYDDPIFYYNDTPVGYWRDGVVNVSRTFDFVAEELLLNNITADML